MNESETPYQTTSGAQIPPSRGRCVIVNADDFGQSSSINEGIIHGHENGIVTSASLMVRWPAAREAARYARDHPALSVGLHLDFGEWTKRKRGWSALYEVVSLEDQHAIKGEIKTQMEAFVALVGRYPSHIDSHQHVHRRTPVLDVLRTSAPIQGVPVRHVTPAIRYEGEFYGQLGDGTPYREGITVPHLVDILRHLPPGITEIACHPGFGGGLETMYDKEREVEVRTLCDPHVRAVLEWEAIVLCSFNDEYIQKMVQAHTDE